MIPICWLGVVISIIALMFAGLYGDVLLGILSAVVGWYCWSLLQEAISDYEDWEDLD